MNIILFGFKGSGKTTLGKLLALDLKKSFIDTDDLIFEQKQCPIPELYKNVGEEKFRKMETEVLLTLASSSNAVISLGGGAVIKEENVTFLKTLGLLIYLDISFETLQKRVSASYALYEARKPLYESISSLKVNLEGLDKNACIQAIKAVLSGL